jgi:hypothetical protein
MDCQLVGAELRLAQGTIGTVGTSVTGWEMLKTIRLETASWLICDTNYAILVGAKR